MLTAIIVIFILGYIAIAFEHPIRINKTATALLTGVLVWTVYAVAHPPASILASADFTMFRDALLVRQPDLSPHLVYAHYVGEHLGHHLIGIAEIVFFLVGAMTIVELIDAHHGFDLVTTRIRTTDTRKLLWLVSILAFFFSALLDNLTTAIVMVTMLRRIVPSLEQRKFFAGIVIIAANAGGAWSPIGDVTTTMLWIGGQISAVNIMRTLILPSLVCMIVPLVFLSFRLRGKLQAPDGTSSEAQEATVISTGSYVMLFSGLAVLLSVPIFKTLTHLPPYLGMMLGLGVLWIISEIVHAGKDDEEKKPYTATHALSRIDMPSMLFFLGILLSISCLESTHLLVRLAEWMNVTIGNLDLVAVAIGLASAIVDNVPLVAASMGMYDLSVYPMDSKLWEFIAYSAGTGGSILIIGSAAGVAVMGMEKIDFIWYLKKISWLALMGFVAGALTYMAVYPVFAVH